MTLLMVFTLRPMMQKILNAVLIVAFCFAAYVFYQMQDKLPKSSKNKEVLSLVTSMVTTLEASKNELGRYPIDFCEAGLGFNESKVLLKYKAGTKTFKLSGVHTETGYTISTNDKRDRLDSDTLANDPDVHLLGPEHPLNCN